MIICVLVLLLALGSYFNAYNSYFAQEGDFSIDWVRALGGFGGLNVLEAILGDYSLLSELLIQPDNKDSLNFDSDLLLLPKSTFLSSELIFSYLQSLTSNIFLVLLILVPVGWHAPPDLYIY